MIIKPQLIIYRSDKYSKLSVLRRIHLMKASQIKLKNEKINTSLLKELKSRSIVKYVARLKVKIGKFNKRYTTYLIKTLLLSLTARLPSLKHLDIKAYSPHSEDYLFYCRKKFERAFVRMPRITSFYIGYLSKEGSFEPYKGILDSLHIFTNLKFITIKNIQPRSLILKNLTQFITPSLRTNIWPKLNRMRIKLSLNSNINLTENNLPTFANLMKIMISEDQKNSLEVSFKLDLVDLYQDYGDCLHVKPYFSELSKPGWTNININHIELDFESLKIVQDFSIKTSLKSLVLNVPEHQKEESIERWDCIANGLSYFTNLETLHLCFGNSEHIDYTLRNEKLKSIFSKVKHLAQLKSLKVQLHQINSSIDDFLPVLNKSLSQIKDFEALDMNVSLSGEFKDEETSRGNDLFVNLGSLPKVRSLEFEKPHGVFSCRFFIKLFPSYNKLKDLTSLKLTFGDMKANNNVVQKLSKLIVRVRTLRELKLGMRSITTADDEDVVKLCLNFRSLQLLNDLDLDLKVTRFNRNMLESLCGSVRLLKRLDRMKIKLHSENKFDSKEKMNQLCREFKNVGEELKKKIVGEFEIGGQYVTL